MGTTLVVNPGSSSKKYALYRDGQSVLDLAFEGGSAGFEIYFRKQGGQQQCESITQSDFSAAFARVAKEVNEYLSAETLTLDAVSVRIVSPGTMFQKHAIIDDSFIALLRSKEQRAPLHIPNILKEIQGSQEHFPAVKIVAASDSAFHASLPFVAREFSLNRDDALTLDIHRFGYHGLSVASVVHRVHSVIGSDPARLVVCHIGNGVSITAVKNGVSVETSMGYSPVSGIPMGSRAGDLDPGALLEIMRSKNLRPSEATVYIYASGGLTGLSGESDIRRLLDRRAKDDTVAKQALELFIYQIKKSIAAATVSLGGIDTLVLTGTASLRSAELRQLIAQDFLYLGMELDENRNDVLVGKEGVISAKTSAVKMVVMRTDEMGEMARISEHFR